LKIILVPEVLEEKRGHSTGFKIDKSKIAAQKAKKAEIEREFNEIFWPAFPNKKSKAKAIPSFQKAREKAGLETIMAGLEAYIANKPIKREWMHPTTFLNQQRWADDYSAEQAQQAAQQQAQGKGRNYGQSNYNNRTKSKGEEFAELWVELSGRRADQGFNFETDEELPAGFLPRTGIDCIGEEEVGEIYLERFTPAFITNRQPTIYRQPA